VSTTRKKIKIDMKVNYFPTIWMRVWKIRVLKHILGDMSDEFIVGSERSFNVYDDVGDRDNVGGNVRDIRGF
jgi:hypothetical protein